MALPPRFLPPLGAPKKSARQRALAEWRGVDLHPLEAARAHPAKAADQLVAAVLKELRMDDRRAEAEIVRVWNLLIDPTLTAHAQPVGLRHGTLFVNVDHSTWLSEIVRYRRHEILERLQSSFGSTLIQRISFRLG